MIEITTCSVSLLDRLHCCIDDCSSGPVSAVLTDDLVEHIRCADHDHGPDVLGAKPLRFAPLWEPS